MYRQLEGDTPSQWTDVGEIYTKLAEQDRPTAFPFTFKKNGNLVTQNPEKGLETVTFVLGHKNVNPPS